MSTGSGISGCSCSEDGGGLGSSRLYFPRCYPPFPRFSINICSSAWDGVDDDCCSFSCYCCQASLLSLNPIPFLLDQLIYHLFCLVDKAVIRRRIGRAPLGVRLLLDYSVVLFSLHEGNDAITLDSRCRNMCGGYSPPQKLRWLLSLSLIHI